MGFRYKVPEDLECWTCWWSMGSKTHIEGMFSGCVFRRKQEESA